MGWNPWSLSADSEILKGLGGEATNLSYFFHSSVSCCEKCYPLDMNFPYQFLSEGVQGAIGKPPALDRCVYFVNIQLFVRWESKGFTKR